MFPCGSCGPQPTALQNQYQPPTHVGYPPQQSNTPYPIGPTYTLPHQQAGQATNSPAYPNYCQSAPVANNQPYPVSTTPLIANFAPASYNENQQNKGYPPYQSQPPLAGQPAQPAQPAQPVYPHNGHGQGPYVASGGNFPQFFGAVNIQQNIASQKATPTVHAAQNVDPVKDAHDLRKAMKGFGTDENALIDIICRRTNYQRQEIQLQFTKYIGRDLIEDVKSETSGNFEKVLVGLLRPMVDFYCEELYDAFKGISTDEGVLIEILCTLSNMEIRAIKEKYLQIYKASLESQLRSETSGNFKKLLTSLCSAARDESEYINPDAAKNDAKNLLKAGEQRIGTDESVFIMILCQRNYQQLKLIFKEYINLKGHSLETAINNEFSGDIKKGLLTIFKCVTNKPQYFASRLYKSMVGCGTKDKQLIRVIITRCEIDMQDIKTEFEELYGKNLKSWIKGNASGDYRNALLALIGETK